MLAEARTIAAGRARTRPARKPRPIAANGADRFKRSAPRLGSGQNRQLDGGVGGRDRDRSVKRSMALVGLDELARLRLADAGDREMQARVFEHRRPFAL